MDVRVRRFQVERGNKVEYWRVYWDHNNPGPANEVSILDCIAIYTEKR